MNDRSLTIQDIDSAHRVLRLWAQARLGAGDDFWGDSHIDGVARAAIDVMVTTYALLRQLELASQASENATTYIDELEEYGRSLRGGAEEHF